MQNEKLIILNIASMSDSKANGVNVVVPEHCYWQNQTEIAAIVNITGCKLLAHEELSLRYEGSKNFPFYLTPPFDKPDLVVFHGVNYFEYIKLSNQLIKAKIKYIVVPHGEITDGALRKKWLKKKLAYMLFFNRFVNLSAGIQCLSAIEVASTKGFRPTIFVATNGVEVYNRVKRYSHIDDIMTLVYIGRLDCEHKGLDKMINGLASSRHRQNIYLKIYGPDILGRKAVLQKVIEDVGATDRISIFPPVYGNEKFDVLDDADVFIQTSNFEGMPVGLLEAMSFGMPVIATKGTNLGIEIQKRDCGWYAGESTLTVAEAIDAAYEERRLCAEKGMAARKFVSDEFDWPTVCAGAIKAYETIVLKDKKL